MSECIISGCGAEIRYGTNNICGIHQLLLESLRGAYTEIREALFRGPQDLTKEEYLIVLRAITCSDPRRPVPGNNWESIYLSMEEALELTGVSEAEIMGGYLASQEGLAPEFFSLPAVLAIKARHSTFGNS